MKKGFTVIELMIVLAIIAILALCAMPLYQHYARDTAARSLLEQLAKAQQARRSHNLDYVYISTDGGQAVLELVKYGFRPDPNVAFTILAPAAAPDGAAPNGFVAIAGHVSAGSTIYVYDSRSNDRPVGPLDAEYPNSPEADGAAIRAYRHLSSTAYGQGAEVNTPATRGNPSVMPPGATRADDTAAN